MAKKLRVVEGYGPLGLRKSPDPKSPLYEEFYSWPDGAVFEPPPHMKVDLALKRGVVEEVEEEVRPRG